MTRLNRLTIFLVGLPIIFLFCNAASAQYSSGNCGTLENGSNGPFDYRTERGHGLKIVEAFHFTSNIENLISGNSAPLGSELDYTLRAFPNHHRALMAMIRLSEKLKSPQPTGSRYSVECWFDRALRFKPDDSTSKMIYATFLAKQGRVPEATKQLEDAAKVAGDNAFTHYNIGLVYFDIKNYEQALTQAHQAYALGFTQPALRDELKNVGKWKEPDEQSSRSISKLAAPDAKGSATSDTDNIPNPDKADVAK